MRAPISWLNIRETQLSTKAISPSKARWKMNQPRLANKNWDPVLTSFSLYLCQRQRQSWPSVRLRVPCYYWWFSSGTLFIRWWTLSFTTSQQWASTRSTSMKTNQFRLRKWLLAFSTGRFSTKHFMMKNTSTYLLLKCAKVERKSLTIITKSRKKTAPSLSGSDLPTIIPTT